MTYPLQMPASPGIKTLGWSAQAVVGVSESPFTLAQQVQTWPGERWGPISVTLPPMRRDRAEVWIAWRLSLRGRAGTFLLYDPDGATPRGTIGADGITLAEPHAVRRRSLKLRGLAAGATVLAGDWLGLGSGATARMHKNLTDKAADSSGQVELEIWPGLRADYGPATVVTTRRVPGVFRMTKNVMPWTSDEAGTFGLSFEAAEVLP